MNNDLISRSALKKAITTALDKEGVLTETDVFKIIDNAPTSELPKFNRGVLEKALEYWYNHIEKGNEEQEDAVWVAINTIRHCIVYCSKYQD